MQPTGIESAQLVKLPPPTVSLTSIPLMIRGDADYNLVFDAKASQNMQVTSLRLEFNPDGSSFQTIATLPAGTTSYNWHTPAQDVVAGSLRLVAVDNRGNSSKTDSNSFEIRHHSPRLAQTRSQNSVVTQSRNIAFGGSCEPGIQVQVDLIQNNTSSSTETVPCTNSSWTFDKTVNQDDNYNYRFKQVDPVGHETAILSSWISDTTPPTFQIGKMNINNGATTSSIYNLPVTLEARDDLAKITDFCLIGITTGSNPPSPTSCNWVPVNAITNNNTQNWVASKSLQIDGTTWKYTRPFHEFTIPSDYYVYAWVRNETGQISTLSANGKGTDNVDRAKITYDPTDPPSVINILVTNTNTPSTPPTDTQLNLSGTTVIKWKASADPKIGLSPQPISLYYTSDGKSYTTIIEHILNGANSTDCSVNNITHSGCYTWSGSNVPSTAIAIRVGAKDNNGVLAFSSSTFINLGQGAGAMRILAGDTDSGVGGSAVAATFIDRGSATIESASSFVVMPDGRIVIIDKSNRLLAIEPATGLLKELVTRCLVATCIKDGPFASATVHYPKRIALDYQNRLIVFDANRLRRFDLVNQQAETLATSNANIAAGTQAAFETASGNATFTPLPNGDIYFADQGVKPVDGGGFFVYKANTGLVSKISFHQPAGSALDIPGCYQNQAAGIDNCVHSLDPNNGSKIYELGANGGKKFDWYNKGTLYYFGVAYDPKDTDANASPLYIYAKFCAKIVGDCGDFHSVRINPTTGLTTEAGPGLINRLGATIADRSTGDIVLLSRYYNGGTYYGISSFNGNLVRLPKSSLSPLTSGTVLAERLLGPATVSVGQCVDGTSALNCGIDLADAFISVDGILYFWDRNRIRVVNPASKVVKTLYGRNSDFGDGGSALSAKFKAIQWIDQWSKNTEQRIVIQDDDNYKLREVTIDGNIELLAGTGQNADPGTGCSNDEPISTQYWGTRYSFAVDPTTGNVLGAPAVSMLDRSAATPTCKGTWKTIASTDLGTYPNGVLGFDPVNKEALRPVQKYSTTAIPPGGTAATGSGIDTFWKLIPLSGAGATPLVGSTGTAWWNEFPWLDSTKVLTTDATVSPSITQQSVDGTRADQLKISVNFYSRYPKAQFDAATSQWLVTSNGLNSIRTIRRSDTVMGTLTHTDQPIGAFTYRADAGGVVYYCSNSDFKVHKVTKLGAGTQVDAVLPWPVASMTCSGRSMLWNPIRKSVIFPFNHNNLMGIAEISDP